MFCLVTFARVSGSVCRMVARLPTAAAAIVDVFQSIFRPQIRLVEFDFDTKLQTDV